jgi:hypothetical protein
MARGDGRACAARRSHSYDDKILTAIDYEFRIAIPSKGSKVGHSQTSSFAQERRPLLASRFPILRQIRT